MLKVQEIPCTGGRGAESQAARLGPARTGSGWEFRNPAGRSESRNRARWCRAAGGPCARLKDGARRTPLSCGGARRMRRRTAHAAATRRATVVRRRRNGRRFVARRRGAPRSLDCHFPSRCPGFIRVARRATRLAARRSSDSSRPDDRAHALSSPRASFPGPPPAVSPGHIIRVFDSDNVPMSESLRL
jgi:hypothetical protein